MSGLLCDHYWLFYDVVGATARIDQWLFGEQKKLIDQSSAEAFLH